MFNKLVLYDALELCWSNWEHYYLANTYFG